MIDQTENGIIFDAIGKEKLARKNMDSVAFQVTRDKNGVYHFEISIKKNNHSLSFQFEYLSYEFKRGFERYSLKNNDGSSSYLSISRVNNRDSFNVTIGGFNGRQDFKISKSEGRYIMDSLANLNIPEIYPEAHKKQNKTPQ